MRRLQVGIEINGVNVYVGDIVGNSPADACFTYADAYLQDPAHPAVSISLPLVERTFDAARTRNFYEGMLPEGFTRRSVAQWMHADAGDYLTILAGLGRECLGAVRITEAGQADVESGYQELTASEVEALAREGATQSAELVTRAHLSLTGASGKVGLYLDENTGTWYLPIGTAPSTHIVKQSHVRYQRIVVNEQLCLLTARHLGIDVPDSHILTTHGGDAREDILFATRRYDRIIPQDAAMLNGLPVPRRLHQEDLAQALGIAAADKYEQNDAGYLSRVFDVLRGHSADPISDQLRLWDICVFNYLVGNTDNHIKNLSLFYSADLRSVRLAPAYDIVSTAVYENSARTMAIGIDARYDLLEIDRTAYAHEAARVGLGTNLAMRHFDRLVEGFQPALMQAVQELTGIGFAEAREIAQMILERGGIARY